MAYPGRGYGYGKSSPFEASFPGRSMNIRNPTLPRRSRRAPPPPEGFVCRDFDYGTMHSSDSYESQAYEPEPSWCPPPVRPQIDTPFKNRTPLPPNANVRQLVPPAKSLKPEPSNISPPVKCTQPKTVNSASKPPQSNQPIKNESRPSIAPPLSMNTSSTAHVSIQAPPPTIYTNSTSTITPAPSVYTQPPSTTYTPSPVYTQPPQTSFPPPPVYTQPPQTSYPPPPVYTQPPQTSYPHPPVYTQPPPTSYIPSHTYTQPPTGYTASPYIPSQTIGYAPTAYTQPTRYSENNYYSYGVENIPLPTVAPASTTVTQSFANPSVTNTFSTNSVDEKSTADLNSYFAEKWAAKSSTESKAMKTVESKSAAAPLQKSKEEKAEEKKANAKKSASVKRIEFSKALKQFLELKKKETDSGDTIKEEVLVWKPVVNSQPQEKVEIEKPPRDKVESHASRKTSIKKEASVAPAPRVTPKNEIAEKAFEIEAKLKSRKAAIEKLVQKSAVAEIKSEKPAWSVLPRGYETYLNSRSKKTSPSRETKKDLDSATYTSKKYATESKSRSESKSSGTKSILKTSRFSSPERTKIRSAPEVEMPSPRPSSRSDATVPASARKWRLSSYDDRSSASSSSSDSSTERRRKSRRASEKKKKRTKTPPPFEIASKPAPTPTSFDAVFQTNQKQFMEINKNVNACSFLNDTMQSDYVQVPLHMNTTIPQMEATGPSWSTLNSYLPPWHNNQISNDSNTFFQNSTKPNVEDVQTTKQSDSNASSSPKEGEIKIFTGIVTQIHENFGMIGDVFFNRSAIKGPCPEVGDQVLVQAEAVKSMPFKWNSKRVQLVTKGSQLEESVMKNDVPQVPLQLKSILKKPPPPPTISKPISPRSLLRNPPPPPTLSKSQQYSAGRTEKYCPEDPMGSPELLMGVTSLTDLGRLQSDLDRRAAELDRRSSTLDRLTLDLSGSSSQARDRGRDRSRDRSRRESRSSERKRETARTRRPRSRSTSSERRRRTVRRRPYSYSSSSSSPDSKRIRRKNSSRRSPLPIKCDSTT